MATVTHRSYLTSPSLKKPHHLSSYQNRSLSFPQHPSSCSLRSSFLHSDGTRASFSISSTKKGKGNATNTNTNEDATKKKRSSASVEQKFTYEGSITESLPNDGLIPMRRILKIGEMGQGVSQEAAAKSSSPSATSIPTPTPTPTPSATSIPTPTPTPTPNQHEQHKQEQQNEKIPTISKTKETREEPKKLKLPHNCVNITKDSDMPIDHSKLLDHIHAGVFLSQKTKKYWVDECGSNCFMLFPKELSITWGEDKNYWRWPLLKDETSDALVDVAELLNVCWLEVRGKFDTSNLSPETTYEVVFVVMLKDPAYGWETPVNLQLVLPDGESQQHQENLLSKVRAQWIELQVGTFHTSTKVGQIQFSMFEYQGGQWKKGLVIKGVVIRPKK